MSKKNKSQDHDDHNEEHSESHNESHNEVVEYYYSTVSMVSGSDDLLLGDDSDDMFSDESENNELNSERVGVFHSEELRNTQEEVSRFYNALLGRNPDEEGLVYWTNALADKAIGGGGNTIQGVAQAFSSSVEFQSIYGSNISNADFINMMYQNILSRETDLEGYDYWLNALEQTGDRGEMIINFSNSAEYVTKTATSIDGYLSNVSLNGYILT